jgi:hypothetical protein
MRRRSCAGISPTRCRASSRRRRPWTRRGGRRRSGGRRRGRRPCTWPRCRCSWTMSSCRRRRRGKNTAPSLNARATTRGLIAGTRRTNCRPPRRRRQPWTKGSGHHHARPTRRGRRPSSPTSPISRRRNSRRTTGVRPGRRPCASCRCRRSSTTRVCRSRPRRRSTMAATGGMPCRASSPSLRGPRPTMSSRRPRHPSSTTPGSSPRRRSPGRRCWCSMTRARSARRRQPWPTPSPRRCRPWRSRPAWCWHCPGPKKTLHRKAHGPTMTPGQRRGPRRAAGRRHARPKTTRRWPHQQDRLTRLRSRCRRSRRSALDRRGLCPDRRTGRGRHLDRARCRAPARAAAAVDRTGRAAKRGSHAGIGR